MLKSTLIIISFALISAKSGINEASEIIRARVENMATMPVFAHDERLLCSKAIPQFYVKTQFVLGWNAEMAQELIGSIKKIEQEGLTPDDYHLNSLENLASKSTKTSIEKADFDMLLSDAFLLLSTHLLTGKVNPEALKAEWYVSKREGNPAELLQLALSSGSIQSTINACLPKHKAYAELKKSLAEYKAISTENWAVMATGITIKIGANDHRIPIIARKLELLGDKSATTQVVGNTYTQDMEDAVKQFQKRHGLEDDGNIGNKTIEALNVNMAQRIQQIEANMERWRWLNQEFSNYYINVNIASYEMEVYNDGEMVRKHKIITGKPARKTPVFTAKMQYLVLNPTWTVPPTILKNDVLPGIQKDPNYLSKKNISVLNSSGVPIDTAGIDWKSREALRYIYRQVPGPDNSLGAVKFIFPNTFDVYLHDTPHREFFRQSERALSSGCIRVHKPLELAVYLLNDPAWTLERINALVASKKTETVLLKEKPDVNILYWTAWIEDGLVHFRKDVYERDKPVLGQLKSNPPSLN